MPRPRGYLINPEALEDWLLARGLTRKQFSELVGVVPSTISGLTQPGVKKGASLPVALRMAEVLRVKPGSIFPDLVGRTPEPEPETEADDDRELVGVES